MTRPHSKMCHAIWGFWWRYTILEGSIQKNLQKRGRDEAFSSQAGKIVKSQYLWRQISDRQQILTGQSNHIDDLVDSPEWEKISMQDVRGSRTAYRQRPRDKNYIFKNPRWRRAAILKIVKSPYLSKTLSDFDDIWYTTADSAPDDSHDHWPIIKIFKIQDGRRPPSWKSLFWP